MPLDDWLGITVDLFSQFLHCLVVLFRLTTINEPGWDPEEVKKRADVFVVIDRACDVIDRIPVELGIVDADGPRSGLLFKTTYLFRAIKTLLMAEMAPHMPPIAPPPQGRSAAVDAVNAADSVAGAPVPDDFLMDLAAEPWLSDIFAPSWNAGMEGSIGFAMGQPLDGRLW